MAGVQVSEAGLFGGERCGDFRVMLRGRGDCAIERQFTFLGSKQEQPPYGVFLTKDLWLVLFHCDFYFPPLNLVQWDLKLSRLYIGCFFWNTDLVVTCWSIMAKLIFSRTTCVFLNLELLFLLVTYLLWMAHAMPPSPRLLSLCSVTISKT